MTVLRKYYFFSAGMQVLFWVPIFYAYQKLMGLSDAQYFEIQSYYYWIFCFLEIPTGWLSDRIGYRRTMVAAGLVMMLSSLSAVYWTTAAGFLFHFFLIALARSLTSGAGSAYLFEYLREQGHEEMYKQAEGRARSVSLVSRIGAWGAAGYLFAWEPTSPYWLTAITCLLAAFAAMTFPRLKIEDSDTENDSAKGAKETSFLLSLREELFGNRRLISSIMMGMGVFVLMRISLVNLYQPLMQAKDFHPTSFGWVLSLMTLVEAVGADRAHLIQKRVSDSQGILLSTLLIAISLSAITLTGQALTIVGFMVFAFFSGVAYPLIRHQVNSAIRQGQFRATLLSMESIFHRAFMGIAALAAAYFVPLAGIGSFLIASCVVVMAVVGLTALLSRQH